MKQSILFIIISLFTFCNSVFAQEKVLNVWSNKIPGAINDPAYKAEDIPTKTGIKLKQVTNPTLDYYPAKENASGAAVIICPGGAYLYLAFQHEGEQVAKWLNGLGISAFVLKYRLPNDAIMENKSIGPLQDAQEAIRLVRRNAKEWNINPNKIGIMGFSAGGHLASTLSTHYNEKAYAVTDSTSARPDFSILAYPVISMDSSITHQGSKDNLLGKNPTEELTKKYSNELQVNSQTPPAFLIHSVDDNAVPIQNSINYVLALKKNKIPCELHIYESGGHGYGLGRTNNTESTWPEACKKWLQTRDIIE